MNEHMLCVDDIREILCISKNNVYKMAKEGNIPCYKCGKVWRFRPSEIESWLKSKRKGSVDGN